MADRRGDMPSPGSVAWLAISEDSADGLARVRTGPLGMQILPLDGRTVPYSFDGGRLRGTRCVWSASTVCAVRLVRGERSLIGPSKEPSVHVLAGVECPGSVFAPACPASGGWLQVIDPASVVDEPFPVHSHVYTLNVPIASTGLDPATVTQMMDSRQKLTGMQQYLLRTAAGLLMAGRAELTTPAAVAGVDPYLGALAGLLLRTATGGTLGTPERAESVRLRVDAIIQAQAGDPSLTPTSIAAQLAISLRQLYRAFDGAESPAARIRRRRLELAAALLATRTGRPQVEAIAQQCGFVSAEYFSRAFRREFGLSPRAYRAAHRDVVAAD